MPSRNVVRQFYSGQYYHVYNRGVAKQQIFLDDDDRLHFLEILERHLDADNISTKQDGIIYHKYNDDLELLAYCLMSNHFHMLVYLKSDNNEFSSFMQAIMTAYTMYFNKKYQRVGHLFQGVFKASMITDDSYLLHITRYIHLNPRNYRIYPHSSVKYYLTADAPTWLHPERILGMFDGDYSQFLVDYEQAKEMFDKIKHDLAHTK
jgi:putative transposase